MNISCTFGQTATNHYSPRQLKAVGGAVRTLPYTIFCHKSGVPRVAPHKGVAPQEVPGTYLKVAGSRKVPARHLPAAARPPQGFGACGQVCSCKGPAQGKPQLGPVGRPVGPGPSAWLYGPRPIGAIPAGQGPLDRAHSAIGPAQGHPEAPARAPTRQGSLIFGESGPPQGSPQGAPQGFYAGAQGCHKAGPRALQ